MNAFELIGTHEIHDATITSIVSKVASLVVYLKSESGNKIVITFNGVSMLISNNPEGMLLYSLIRKRHQENTYRYTFVN